MPAFSLDGWRIQANRSAHLIGAKGQKIFHIPSLHGGWNPIRFHLPKGTKDKFPQMKGGVRYLQVTGFNHPVSIKQNVNINCTGTLVRIPRSSHFNFNLLETAQQFKRAQQRFITSHRVHKVGLIFNLYRTTLIETRKRQPVDAVQAQSVICLPYLFDPFSDIASKSKKYLHTYPPDDCNTTR